MRALDRTLSDMGVIPNCPSCGREVEHRKPAMEL